MKKEAVGKKLKDKENVTPGALRYERFVDAVASACYEQLKDRHLLGECRFPKVSLPEFVSNIIQKHE